VDFYLGLLTGFIVHYLFVTAISISYEKNKIQQSNNLMRNILSGKAKDEKERKEQGKDIKGNGN